MAGYARDKKNTEERVWKIVPDMEAFSVIGNRDRFSIAFDVCEGLRITLNGCRVVDGSKGLFISYPSWKDKEGNYHPYSRITFSDEESMLIIKALD